MKKMMFVVLFAVVVVVFVAESASAQAQQVQDPCADIIKRYQARGDRTENLVLIGGTVAAERINRYGYSQAGSLAQSIIWARQNQKQAELWAAAQNYSICAQLDLENQRLETGKAVEMARIGAQLEASRNETAARVFQTAAETGSAGTASVNNGVVSVCMTKTVTHDQDGGTTTTINPCR